MYSNGKYGLYIWEHIVSFLALKYSKQKKMFNVFISKELQWGIKLKMHKFLNPHLAPLMNV